MAFKIAQTIANITVIFTQLVVFKIAQTIATSQSSLHSSGWCGFQVKDVYVHSELFSVENGLLTPTFKAKRQEMAKQFRPQVEEMYSRLA